MLELENQSLKSAVQQNEQLSSQPSNDTSSVLEGSLVLNLQERQSVVHNLESIRALLAQTHSAVQSATSMMENIEEKFK